MRYSTHAEYQQALRKRDQRRARLVAQIEAERALDCDLDDDGIDAAPWEHPDLR